MLVWLGLGYGIGVEMFDGIGERRGLSEPRSSKKQ